MKWVSCCKGRASSCPEIAVEGNFVHIKDDYGNEVTVHKDNFPLFQEPGSEDVPEDPVNLNDQTVRIHGKEKGKPPVRMSLLQFYQVLETVDGIDSGAITPVEPPPVKEGSVVEEKTPKKKKKKKKVK